MKTIDLTIRQIIEICDKNNGNCKKCPLFTTMLACHKFNKRYGTIVTYDIEKLMKEEVEDDEEERCYR